MKGKLMRLRLALGTSQGGNDPLWRPGKLHSAIWAEEVVGLCLFGNLLFGPDLPMYQTSVVGIGHCL